VGEQGFSPFFFIIAAKEIGFLFSLDKNYHRKRAFKKITTSITDMIKK